MKTHSQRIPSYPVWGPGKAILATFVGVALMFLGVLYANRILVGPEVKSPGLVASTVKSGPIKTRAAAKSPLTLDEQIQQAQKAEGLTDFTVKAKSPHFMNVTVWHGDFNKVASQATAWLKERGFADKDAGIGEIDNTSGFAANNKALSDWNKVGELNDKLIAEKAEADKILAAQKKAGDAKLPFTPHGSLEMSTRWGRNLNTIIHEGNSAARQLYDEYCFFPDGTYYRSGAFLGEPISHSGFYRLDGKRLKLYEPYEMRNGYQYALAKPAYWEAEIATDPGTGFQAFIINGVITYDRGLTWNFDFNCYIDDEGNRYKARN